MTVPNHAEPVTRSTAVTPCDHVRESAEFIAAHSRDVAIPEAGIHLAARKLYARFQRTPYARAVWKSHELNPQTNDARTVDWIFLIDTLNFSFWSDTHRPGQSGGEDETYAVRYRGRDYTGYWALCAAVNRALDEGFPCTTATFMATADDATWTHIFRSATAETIPLFETRLRVVREAGKVLLARYDGSFTNFLCPPASNGSLPPATAQPNDAPTTVARVLDAFPSYRDMATFHGRTVWFCKRAQILVADLWACFDNTGYGAFTRIDDLTMFADYRVPQALVHIGVLQYSERLRCLLSGGTATTGFQPTFEVLAPGSCEEIEIRGNAILAVERLCHAIRTLVAQDNAGSGGGKGPEVMVNPILLDFYLWDLAKEQTDQLAYIPIHRTRTHFY
ncbi:hypothetical protein IWQ60_004448 [Tieghemiomyces parasiticus]|uniref:Queuosine 5'-phosphate N-glycosylase/hydrolase n=1 Tax=Tieghemiomyces parasiticus TaxID=78921 RepID=A0A9W8A8C7_9FUNG|nr:hypothetical protein IWQ60_004448 [Tieghemiomyces parasiticus]